MLACPPDRGMAIFAVSGAGGTLIGRADASRLGQTLSEPAGVHSRSRHVGFTGMGGWVLLYVIPPMGVGNRANAAAGRQTRTGGGSGPGQKANSVGAVGTRPELWPGGPNALARNRREIARAGGPSNDVIYGNVNIWSTGLSHGVPTRLNLEDNVERTRARPGPGGEWATGWVFASARGWGCRQ